MRSPQASGNHLTDPGDRKQRICFPQHHHGLSSPCSLWSALHSVSPGPFCTTEQQLSSQTAARDSLLHRELTVRAPTRLSHVGGQAEELQHNTVFRHDEANPHTPTALQGGVSQSSSHTIHTRSLPRLPDSSTAVLEKSLPLLRTHFEE